jgi:hypothetical protein
MSLVSFITANELNTVMLDLGEILTEDEVKLDPIYLCNVKIRFLRDSIRYHA